MTERPVLSNDRGFTLVEMVIAMVVILVALLGLVQATFLSIDSNMKNLLRDEAVRLAEEQMDVAKSHPITDDPYVGVNPGLAATTNQALNSLTGNPIVRSFGSFPAKYAVYITIADLYDNKRKSIQVTVGWNYKNELPLDPNIHTEYQFTISTIVASAS